MNETRNYLIDQEEYLEYKHGKISAYRECWEEYNDKKEKWEPKKNYVCHLSRPKLNFLNLGEMSDGGRFTAVTQAINEAKSLIDYDIERRLDTKLRDLGHTFDSLLYLNKLKVWERLEAKEKIIKTENEKHRSI